MRRAKTSRSRHADLPLPASSSSMPRQSDLHSHSFSSKLHDDGKGDSDGGEDEEVDANLEEELLLEIRTLVKKEKYLAHLENQLLEPDDEVADSRSDFSESDRARNRDGVECEDLYDANDELHQGKQPTERSASSSIRLSRGPRAPSRHEDRQLRSPAPGRAPTSDTPVGQEHFRACFVELNPVQLREIRDLQLPSQRLHLHHLRALSKNLFLFSDLRSVNLADNQLDDAGSKEIREATKPVSVAVITAVSETGRCLTASVCVLFASPGALMCCPGLRSLDLSRNSLGRLTARTICERLQHQVKLRVLDLHGNLFFSDDGDAAGEIARLFAKAVAVNEFIVHFCLSALDRSASGTSLSTQRMEYSAPQRKTTRVRSKGPGGKTGDSSSAAEQFSRLLAEHLQQRREGGAVGLQSLGLCYAEISRKVVLNAMKMANRLTALDLSFAFIGISGAQVVAAALKMKGYATLTQLNLRCNRTKSMGAKAILAALRVNDRLTALDLSRNEIRSDVADEVAALLVHNQVLTRLDLSQNEILAANATQVSVRCLCDAIAEHRALLSLGLVSSLGGSEGQARMLQDALDENRIADDQGVLDAINAGMTPTNECATEDAAKRLVPSTMVLLQAPAHCFTQQPSHRSTFTTVWKHTVSKEARVSLKWKMTVKMAHKSSTGFSEEGGGDHRHRAHSGRTSPLVWKVLVQRKCSVREALEDEAATALFPISEGAYELYSAVAYCDTGDTISLELGIADDKLNDNDFGSKMGDQQFKVFVKEIVLVSHHRFAVSKSQSNTAAFSDLDQEGEPAPPFLMPLSVKDEEEEDDNGLAPKARVQSDQTPMHQPDLQQLDKENDAAPRRARLPKRTSESKLTNVSWALTGVDKLEPISPKKPSLGSPGINQSSKRRVTVSVDNISPHALDRLGVNADILKKEKGMKKLGICDVDIIRSEELRRYTGISQLAPNSKVEFMFGFNDEQLHRDKAIKRLGTSEQEILDDYSRRVSRLGISNHFPTGAKLQL
ncbi:hypothetical protein BBJ28_00021685 [Nothophytophthora sp. Chile5]|nr:hypothetical protein BBJ28_00021685 [Nothophytophthora sp. Chile5]